MNQQLPKVVEQVKEILPELAWPVKEVSSAVVEWSNGAVNRKCGCYTSRVVQSRAGAWPQNAWVGFVEHQKLEAGLYASISTPPGQIIIKVLRNGYREAPFGPHPWIKKLISQKEIDALRHKSGPAAVARKLKSLLKKTYPFKKIK